MTTLARNWWALVLRGVLAVLFGLAAFAWPGLTLTVLVLLFGLYALVDGILAIVAAFRASDRRGNWWALIVEGIVGIGAGLAAFFWPGVTALVVLYIIAIWAIITGVLEVIAAIRLREEIPNEWVLGLTGLASVIFGLILVFFPGAGALAVVWIIGIYALIFGVLMIVLGFRLRQPELA